ncbi:phenoloxidase-activating factor 2 [Lepeophtheirus salmonis]|uniref:phenoloxidase-activating factor 2 n=1 Tax=Lepeophtheirus salmonis TaxID=72036 RepID=UPI001AE774AF|nr:phenoloxidase-activating factor 2-like [Lepeophtheirus salmonis]
MKVLIYLVSLVLIVRGHPQGYGVVDEAGPGEDDLNLIDDVFGGGKTNDAGNNGGIGEINSKPEPNYGDGGSHVNEVVDTSYEDCAYYADQDYKCVPYYTCEDGEIVTDGGGLIDIRSSFAAVLDPASSKCPGYLEVCCRHPDFSTNSPVVTQTTTPEPVTQPPKPRTYIPECGRRNIGGVGVRIQNDKFKGSTQFGEWPHMCAVLEIQAVAYGEDINKYVCGASLIAPGVVLTGAHCVAKIPKENIKIRCGEWDTQKQIEPSEHQDRFVEALKVHPLFDPKNLKNDFALLFMEEDFKLAPHVDTICLPDNLAGINSYDQEDCFATGWGKDKFGKLGEYQVIMKQVNMDMVNATECERRLRRTRLGVDFELDKSFVCAGGEKDRDTCKGDGGGPLVCPLHREGSGDGYGVVQPHKYIQAGIIAWGIDCGVEGNPGVYANVADGLCFIDWATQCQTGIPQYFNITGCENWASHQIESIKYKIHEYQKKLNYITKDGSGTKSNIRNLHRRINKEKKRLEGFEEEQSICIAASGYVEINTDILGTDGRLINDNSSEENSSEEDSDGVYGDKDQNGGKYHPEPIVDEPIASGY